MKILVVMNLDCQCQYHGCDIVTFGENCLKDQLGPSVLFLTTDYKSTITLK